MKRFSYLRCLTPAIASIIFWHCLQAKCEIGMVILSNLDSNSPIFWFDGMTTRLAPMQGTFAQVFGGLMPNQLEPIPTVGYSRDIFPFIEPGFFDGGGGVVPGTQGGETAWFEVRAWRGGTTWEEAARNPAGFIGRSEIFQNLVGPSGGPSGSPANPAVLNAPSFTIFPVPEPATWALGLLGMVLLLIAKRRQC